MASICISRRVSDPFLAMFDVSLQIVAKSIADRLGLDSEYWDPDGDGYVTLGIEGTTVVMGKFIAELYNATGVSGLVIALEPEEDPAPIQKAFAMVYPGEIMPV